MVALLRQVQPIDATFVNPEHFLEAFAQLMAETDRGCALVAAAMLDDALERLLRSVFIDPAPKEVEELFKGNGALAHFSARAALCRALGLITPHEHADITLIRKIRNECAHELAHGGFDDLAVRSRCVAFKLLHSSLGNASPRSRFINAACLLLGALDGKCTLVEHCTPPDETNVNEMWKPMLEALKGPGT